MAFLHKIRKEYTGIEKFIHISVCGQEVLWSLWGVVNKLRHG